MKKAIPQGGSEPPKKPTKRKLRTFEAEPDVAQVLDACAEAELVLTDIVNEALRKFGPQVLADHARRLREKADKTDQIAKNISAGKR